MSLTMDLPRTVRLRREGRAVIVAIPTEVQRELALKPGDLMVMVAIDGNLLARKVDLTKVMEGLSAESQEA